MEYINQRENHLVGNNIRRIRLEKGLRNRDVVAKLQLLGVDITAGRLSKVELGLNNPSVNLLRGLTQIYKCDYNAFFSEEPEMYLKSLRSNRHRLTTNRDMNKPSH